jgi:hypothetical protein
VEPDDEMTVWRRGAHVAYVDREGRSALLDLDHLDRPPFVFEGSAAEIWQRIDGTREDSAIVAELVELYGEAEGIIAPAVSDFLDDLATRGLVEEVSGD